MKKFNEVYKTLVKESKQINEASGRITYGDLLKQLKELSQEELRLPVIMVNTYNDEHFSGNNFTNVSDIAKRTLEDRNGEEPTDSEVTEYINKEMGYKNVNHPIIEMDN